MGRQLLTSFRLHSYAAVLLLQCTLIQGVYRGVYDEKINGLISCEPPFLRLSKYSPIYQPLLRTLLALCLRSKKKHICVVFFAHIFHCLFMPLSFVNKFCSLNCFFFLFANSLFFSLDQLVDSNIFLYSWSFFFRFCLQIPQSLLLKCNLRQHLGPENCFHFQFRISFFFSYLSRQIIYLTINFLISASKPTIMWFFPIFTLLMIVKFSTMYFFVWYYEVRLIFHWS